MSTPVCIKGESQWDDLSVDAADRYLAAIEGLSDRAARIPNRLLSAEQQTSLALLERELSSAQTAKNFRDHGYVLSHMGGWHTTVPNTLMNYQSIDTIQEAHAYIERINAVQPLFDQLIDQLSRAERNGYVLPSFAFDAVINASENMLKGAPLEQSSGQPEHIIWQDFKSKIEPLGLYPSSEKVLLKKAERALKRRFKPAYERLIQKLESQQANAKAHPTLASLPNGAAYYQWQLQQHTTTSFTAAEIHDIGLSEVARIQSAIVAMAPEIGLPLYPMPDSVPEEDRRRLHTAQVFEWLAKRPDPFAASHALTVGEHPEAHHQAFVDFQLDRVRYMSTQLTRAFHTVPATPVVVKAVEPYRRSSAPIAFYESPAQDGTRPGVYYVNPDRKADLPAYRLAALAFHEALPGHHLQIALAQENNELPDFQRHLHINAYSEGWALYAEKLALELGGYRNAEEKLGQLVFELWRAVRLVIDTGLHDQDWSRQQALDYRLANTPFNKDDSIKAIERYLVMPGQATSYKIGAMEIEQLRSYAEGKLGKNFQLDEFHHQILRQGPLPLALLKAHIHHWVESQD